MSRIQCLKKTNFQVCEQLSSKKLLKFVKAVKPVLRLIRRKNLRTNVVTPSSCNYDVVETLQNDANELEFFRLDFRFPDDDAGNEEAQENLKNEELEKRLLEKLHGEDGGARRLPVCGADETESKSAWAPRSDMDICKRGDEYVTSRQRAEQQVPAATN